MILVETLEIFPVDHPKRNQIIIQLNNLLESLKNTQDNKTGLWYQVVDKGHLPDNWHDTSGSAMFTYTIRKAIDLGFANPEIYTSIANKGYEGIISKAKINDAGFIDIYDACNGLGVQKDYSAYINFKKTVNAQEAIAAFLWATTLFYE